MSKGIEEALHICLIPIWIVLLGQMRSRNIPIKWLCGIPIFWDVKGAN